MDVTTFLHNFGFAVKGTTTTKQEHDFAVFQNLNLKGHIL